MIDGVLNDCRIHRVELSRFRQCCVQVFVLLGMVLAVVIVHANVVTLVHASHTKPLQGVLSRLCHILSSVGPRKLLA